MAFDKGKINSVIVRQCCVFVLIFSVVSCIKFGLISPIEVVEEWGCQDSEIRLTCRSLDSTIAILSATFKPNCSAIERNTFQPSTNSSNNSTNKSIENCVNFDLRRLTPPNIPKVDHRVMETLAGRKFLEALRQNHKEDEEFETSDPTVQNVQAASFAPSNPTQKDPTDLKKKRMTLRASLEELLVEYLRGLVPESDDANSDLSRVKRSLNKSVLSDRKNDEIDQPIEVDEQSENVQSNDENSVQNGERGNSSKKSVCAERRHRITQLDRSEINDSLHKESDDEYNIRRLLNHRCSGKNHCSFLFNEDHPFSIIWPEGIVHIKYICMERYRVNKFCGEHLIIANESPVPDPTYHPTQQRSPSENDIEIDSSGNENKLDGPVAEALIQNEQMFHQLKIWKPSPSELENERKKAAAVNNAYKQPSIRKGVYSQDFRAMKILPANLDDFNDIEKIGDEFYFRKDDHEKSSESDENMHLDRKDSVPPKNIPEKNHIDHSTTGLENEFDDSKNGLRDVRSTLGYDELNNRASLESQETAQGTVTPLEQTSVNVWENDLLPPNTNIFETFVTDEDRDVLTSNLNKNRSQTHSNFVEETKTYTTASDFTAININRADIEQKQWENDEDYDSSYEDYAVEVKGAKVSRKNKIRVHTSYQKTAIRQPLLLHGFIASPGYPKYYIGNVNCSWRITVPKGQRIKLIVLDVNLRYDTVCKDFLQIVDIGSKRTLFRNCTELNKPLEISSESNELQITLKTASTLVYPKRGVLFYYSAHGCILPTAPKHGRLVFKTENFTKFLCDPTYVFPDTIESSRILTCNSRNVWDKSLPNCVEHSTVPPPHEKPYIQSLWKQNRVGSPHEINQADGMYDILIPSMIIIGLLIINAIVLLVIWKYRSKKNTENGEDALAQL